MTMQLGPGNCPVHKTPLVYFADEFYYCDTCEPDAEDDDEGVSICAGCGGEICDNQGSFCGYWSDDPDDIPGHRG